VAWRGVHDFWLLGRPVALGGFVESLWGRISRHGLRPANARAHFAFEEHATATGLAARGLWMSHPAAVSFVDFTLHRWRAEQLEWRGDNEEAATEGAGEEVGDDPEDMSGGLARAKRGGSRRAPHGSHGGTPVAETVMPPWEASQEASQGGSQGGSQEPSQKAEHRLQTAPRAEPRTGPSELCGPARELCFRIDRSV